MPEGVHPINVPWSSRAKRAERLVEELRAENERMIRVLEAIQFAILSNNPDEARKIALAAIDRAHRLRL